MIPQETIGNNKTQETIDSYEREKILNSVGDLRLLAETMEAFVELADFIDKQGISYQRDPGNTFDDLRQSEGPFGPQGQLHQEIVKLNNDFQKAQKEMYNLLSPEQREKFRHS